MDSGVQLYYLKDYNNNPVIIINIINDPLSCEDRINFDEIVGEAFIFIFSNLIDHINTVCFINKSNDNRFDMLSKYTFCSVANLFS